MAFFIAGILLVYRLQSLLSPRVNPILTTCLSTLFDVPFGILLVRTATAPEVLPFFDVRRAVRVLLSPAERRRPWLLYLTPGVLPVVILELAIASLILHIENSITHLVVDRKLSHGVSTRMLVGLGFVLLRTAVDTPLEVIVVRLAIQRNHPALSLDEEDINISSEEIAEFLTTEEQVLELRTDQPPYTGAWNCVKCIINEEGFGVLYRGWWFTLLMFLNGWRVTTTAKHRRYLRY
ncbi:hypothetical protein BS17DRAFT_783469, partial [Gyrodon lividus]